MGSVLHDMVRRGRSFSGRERNCAFLNLGAGKFADVSSVSGFDFPDDGRAVARCDWDGDGDLDFWLANRSGPQVRFLQNRLATDNHFLSLKLRGETCNRDAIGARVEIQLGDEVATTLIKTLRAGEGFLTQSSKQVHFGLGANQAKVKVTVHWPGGEREEFGDLNVDQHYLIVEGTGKPEIAPIQKVEIAPSKPESPAANETRTGSVVSGAQLPVPQLSYVTVDGHEKTLNASGDKRYLLVNLWASWCRPCLVELKEFERHADELRAAQIEVAALSVDQLDSKGTSSAKAASNLLRTLKLPGVSGWATSETAETLRLVQENLFDFHQPMSLPTNILIDPQGRLAILYRGPVSVEQLLQDVERLEGSEPHEGLPFPGRWRSPQTQLSPFDLVWNLVESGHLNQAITYINDNYPLLESHYNMPKLLTLVGNSELAGGKANEAVRYYRSALKLDRSYSDAQNNLAWILSTHPDDSLRNGEEALRYAEAALRQGRGNLISMLDTLAAALAENGMFDQAVRAASKAVEMAEKERLQVQANQIRSRLKMYKKSQPYRSE